MQSQRKFRPVAIVAAMAIVLSGCSSAEGQDPSATGDKTTITWMQWWANEQGWEKLDNVKAAFEEAHPDIELEIEDVPAGQAHDKLTTLALANEAPDVMSMQSSWLTEFAAANIISPIDDYLADSELPKQIDQALLSEYQGHVWATPSSMSDVAMYYNQDLLDEAGVSVPTTWEEYREAAKAVSELSGKYGTTANLGTEPPTPISYEIFPFIISAGGKILDEDGNAAFASEEGEAALEFVNDIWNVDGSATPGIAAANETEKRENFAAGNTGFMFDGPAGVNIVAGSNPDLNYGIAAMPVGKVSGTFANGSVLGISSASEKKDAAFTFIEWLSGPEGGAVWAEQLGFFPPNVEAQKASIIADSPQLSVFAQIAAETENVEAIDPLLPDTLQLRRTLTESLQGYFTGEVTAAEALQEAEDAWNSTISEARE